VILWKEPAEPEPSTLILVFVCGMAFGAFVAIVGEFLAYHRHDGIRDTTGPVECVTGPS